MSYDPPKDSLYRGVIPYLALKNAGAASDFYQRAFGAKEMMRMTAPDNAEKVIHCRLEINGGLLMLSDDFPERGFAHQPSHSFTMQLIVGDIDAWWARAVEAGFEVKMPVARMFWGDRYGQLCDPFGVLWAMNEPAA